MPLIKGVAPATAAKAYALERIQAYKSFFDPAGKTFTFTEDNLEALLTIAYFNGVCDGVDSVDQMHSKSLQQLKGEFDKLW